MRKKHVEKDNAKKGIVLIALSLLIIFGTIIAVMVGVSNTVGELAVEINNTHADAILAKSDVNDETIIKAPILYYVQEKDECVDLYNTRLKGALEARQFEWSKCGYQVKTLEKEITSSTLNSEHLPTAFGGEMLPNRGVKGEAFNRWFNEVEGKSRAVASTIDLKYDTKLINFSYDNDGFYPFGKDILFTFNLGIPIEILSEGKEDFSIVADDDTWVYIDDKIILDMGGIHKAVSGEFRIHDNGEVYSAVGNEELAYSGIKLEKNAGAVIRIFHANRDSGESVFKLSFSNMVFNMVDTTLARVDAKDNDGLEVAYVSPEDSEHAKPLGETSTHGPSKSRMIAASMTAQVSALAVVVVGVGVIISGVLRYWRRGHNQG